jgi:hypothetical protein
MCENDGLTNGQSQAMAGRVTLLCGARAEERLEDPWAILEGYSRSFVLHRELQSGTANKTSRYPDCARWRRVLGCVLE